MSFHDYMNVKLPTEINEQATEQTPKEGLNVTFAAENEFVFSFAKEFYEH